MPTGESIKERVTAKSTSSGYSEVPTSDSEPPTSCD